MLPLHVCAAFNDSELPFRWSDADFSRLDKIQGHDLGGVAMLTEPAARAKHARRERQAASGGGASTSRQAFGDLPALALALWRRRLA